MEWSEVTIQVPVQAVETAAAIAQMAVPYGIYIEDYSDLTSEAPRIAHIDLIDEELLGRDRTQARIHLYIKPSENPGEAVSFLAERLSAEGIEHQITTKSVLEEDWATAWKKYYHALAVGKRLVICPSWEQYDRRPGDVVITLDPGMAFGTGTHETTRLCMQLLEEYVTPQTELLDVGCGSGILSIAALLLGAKRATGVDIDDTAVRIARENAVLNQVQGRATFLCGDLAGQAQGQFDLICANIVADVIIRLSPSLPQHLRRQGVFIASGIIAERASEVERALEAVDLQVVERCESGGWTALACRFSENKR